MLSVFRTEGNSRNGLEDLIAWAKARIPLHRMAEVGSYAGESTVLFAAAFDLVYAIDGWNAQSAKSIEADGWKADIEAAEASFDERASLFPNVSKLKATSPFAASYFLDRSLNLVYIDADHAYDAVLADIRAWTAKLASPGIMSGHDYDGGHEGVARAVRETFGDVAHFVDGSWAILVESPR